MDPRCNNHRLELLRRIPEVYQKKRETNSFVSLLCWRRPIFPVRLQTSIVGTVGLNCRVRNGYGWTPAVITTNYHQGCALKTEQWMGLGGLAKRVCIMFRSSPRVISIGQLNTLLCVHFRPINDVVYIDPYSIKDGRSYLRGSFTLRCFQRLSRPDVATQLCRWHDNWCTRGLSIPVLSY